MWKGRSLGVGFFQFHQRIAFADQFALTAVQRLDDTGMGRADAVFHLHRLQHHQRGTSFDGLANLDQHPDDAATAYLNKSSREQLRAKFLPIVKQATDQVGLAKQYNSFAGQAASFGAIDAKSAKIENYVTEEALDGLFKVIAEQEGSIRKNPAAAATSLAKKVFGAN